MTTDVTVLVVDDQTLLRQGVVALLKSREGVRVVGEASNGEEAISQVARYHPDVVLMDVKMPVLDGVQATRQIVESHPETRVVLLTMFPDETAITGGLAAGACGFLLKDIAPLDLAQAITTARAGDSPLDPKVARLLLNDYTRLAQHGVSRPVRPDGLSSREVEVLQCVSRGASNKQIAAELCISIKTVKTHLRNIFRKLGFEDRTQAAVYVITHGL